MVGNFLKPNKWMIEINEMGGKFSNCDSYEWVSQVIQAVSILNITIYNQLTDLQLIHGWSGIRMSWVKFFTKLTVHTYVV